MVFSINADPNSPKSFEAFQQIAVHKNGTGVVDPFATNVPSAAPTPTPAPGGSKNALDADFGSKSALGDSTDGENSNSDMLRRLTNTYAPVLGGLLVATIVMLLALMGMAVVLLRRTRRANGSTLPGRNVAPSYQQVPLNLPKSTMADTSKYEYEEPKYQHYDRD